MKLLHKFIFPLTAVVFATVLAGCSKTDAEKPAAASEKTEAPGQTGVTLDAVTQARLGLEITNLMAAEWQPEIKAFGRVLDPAPLQEMLMELGRAEMTFDSSHQELERAKLLKKDSNISERAFQDAEANYKQNFAAVDAIHLKIATVWGKRIPEMMGPIVVPPGTERKPDEFLKKFPDSVVLIRVDLPAGERLAKGSPAARIVSLGKQTAPVEAGYFEKLPVVDPQTQQQGILFFADRLTPGEAVTAFIKTGGNPVSGVTVPASAVLRHEGKAWVYVQTAPNQFVRTEIPLDRLTDNGWFVSENWSATNRIVVSGAQAVLSAELTPPSAPAPKD